MRTCYAPPQPVFVGTLSRARPRAGGKAQAPSRAAGAARPKHALQRPVPIQAALERDAKQKSFLYPKTQEWGD